MSVVECVGALCTYREKILLVDHKTRGIELPGGHKKKGESDAQACIRECEEETGIEVLRVNGLLHTVYRGDTECKFYACDIFVDKPFTNGESDVKRAWFGFVSELGPWVSPELIKVITEHLKEKHAKRVRVLANAFPGLTSFTIGNSNADLFFGATKKTLDDFCSGSKERDVLYSAFELPVGTYKVEKL